MSQVRVRIAPSPTGPDVHIGNVRTALFNYLYAKQKGGAFVFRIEDSDTARSKPEYADAIAKSLDWLGLKADEGYGIGGDYGPYSQMEKLDRYKKAADELIERGAAYRCYCTQDELNALRNQLPEKQRDRFRYPGICRDRKDWPNGKDYVVRFKAPLDGAVEINDTVFGRITVPNKENFDWVLMRVNGVPLYNFGCVIDDIDMLISAVVRGRDHLVNTPIQILLYQAFNAPVPEMAHLPMMLGPDGSKLSKRHGSVSITEYRNAGYSPNGILSYLAKFGFGYKDQELFTLDELVEVFSLESCGKNDGRFDPKKFSAIQFEHLKSETLTPTSAYASLLLPFLQAKSLNPSQPELERLVPLVRSRSHTFADAANELDPILRKTISIDENANKLLTPDTKLRLKDFSTFLATINTWDEITLRTSTQDWLKKTNLTLKDVGQPTRCALVGRTTSPELFQTMAAIGKETTIERLSR